jgi:hypothetical protein
MYWLQNKRMSHLGFTIDQYSASKDADTNLLKYVISYVHVSVWKRDRSSSTVLRFRQFFSCNNLFTMDVVFIGRVSLPSPFYRAAVGKVQLFFGYFGITVEIIACCLYFFFLPFLFRL